MSAPHHCGPDAGCDNECAVKAYDGQAQREAIAAARAIALTNSDACAAIVAGRLNNLLVPLLAAAESALDEELVDACRQIEEIAKALGGMTAHDETIERARRLANWGRDVGHGAVSAAAQILAAELRNIAHIVSTCEPHEREEIAARLVELAAALKGEPR